MLHEAGCIAVVEAARVFPEPGELRRTRSEVPGNQMERVQKKSILGPKIMFFRDFHGFSWFWIDSEVAHDGAPPAPMRSSS